MKITHGTCSICGGAVTSPMVWHGIAPPSPSCSSCGAVPVQAHGPVIPMQPRPPGVTVSDSSATVGTKGTP